MKINRSGLCDTMVEKMGIGRFCLAHEPNRIRDIVGCAGGCCASAAGTSPAKISSRVTQMRDEGWNAGRDMGIIAVLDFGESAVDESWMRRVVPRRITRLGHNFGADYKAGLREKVCVADRYWIPRSC